MEMNPKLLELDYTRLHEDFFESLLKEQGEEMLRGKAYCKRQSKEWRVRPLVVRPQRAQRQSRQGPEVRPEKQPLEPRQEEEEELTN